MHKVADGDIRQSAVLFERYNIKIYNFYLKSTYDEFLSKDLTQQVFVKLIKYRTSFKNDHSFKSWIFRIATNVKYDHYRKEKSYKNRNETYNGQQSHAYDPSKIIEKTEQEKQLHRALKQLPEGQREVIWLTRFEKMKYADVAKIFNCTESAIKVKVHRAIKRLKIEFHQLEEL